MQRDRSAGIASPSHTDGHQQSMRAKTGKTAEVLYAMAAGSAPVKVSEQRQWLMAATSLCQASKRIESEARIDDMLPGWLKMSFNEAG